MPTTCCAESRQPLTAQDAYEIIPACGAQHRRRPAVRGLEQSSARPYNCYALWTAMKICAVILNYFGADDTIACVRQLLRQPLERICVADNSADRAETGRLAETFAPHSRVHLLDTGTNCGFAGGINHCLRSQCLPDFDAVLVMNNDTVITDGFVATLADGASKDGLHIAGPRIHHHPDTGRLWSRGCFYNCWFGTVTGRSWGMPGAVFYLTGCCMLIQRCVLDTIGLFDERFFMYGEDVEFCSRAARAGLRLGVVDEALLFHKTSASAINNSRFYEHQVARAHRLLSYSLHAGSRTARLSLYTKAPVLAVRALVRTARFGNLRALRALRAEFFHSAPDRIP